MKAFFTLLLFTIVALFVKPAAVHAQAANATDSLALVDLYNASNGPAWTNHTNWLTTASLTTWYGIKLDVNGRVTDASLDTNNLVGTVPASMGSLIKMQHLYLNANKLTGPVPASFNNYTRLLALDLSNNRFNFDGMEQLNSGILLYTTLGKQAALPLTNNNGIIKVSGAGGTAANKTYYLNGAAPASADSVFTVKSGKHFIIVKNSNLPNFQLSSDTINITVVPPVVAYAKDSLAVVDLYNTTNGPGWANHTNWLTGARLATWSGITLDSAGSRVISISLPANNLTGQLQASFGNLTALTQLNLSNNQLSGALPAKFYALYKLVNLYLSHNSFTGLIPNGSQVYFDTADFSYNQFQGQAMLFEHVMYEYLGHNHFTSVLAVNASAPPPVIFDVTYNDINFTGVSALTAYGTSVFKFQPQNHVKLNVNNFRLSVSITGASRYSYTDYAWYNGATLVQTTIGDSTLLVTQNGQYSVVITDENLPAGYAISSDTVTVIVTPRTGDSLALVDLYNSTSGPGWVNHTNWLTGPVRTWQGITLSKNGIVTNIALSANNLAGTLPASLSNLTGMLTLEMQNNKLTGAIPALIGNMAGLQILNLSNNQLTSNIPPSITNMTGLTWLDISSNQLTGSMPLQIGNNTALTNLNMSGNQLTGSIPDGITNLINLLTLNLSYNQLTGQLPVNIGNISLLQDLELSHNNLGNYVPTSLNNLKVVGRIDIIGNRFQFLGLTSLNKHALSVLMFNYQQDIPLVFDTNTHFLSMDVETDGPGIPVSLISIDWTIPPTNDTQPEPTDGGFKEGTSWHVSVPGYFQCNATCLVTLSAAYKFHFYLSSEGRTMTEAELPVKLTTFTGQLTHGQAFLNWQTASELNSAYFGVQRSIDGTNFTTIGKVAAAGTSAVAQNYAFTDALTGLAAMPAQLYYRLQQVDKDGKQNMSKTIVLTPAPGGSSSLIMYPNPVRSILNLRLKGIPGNAAITITDAGGKTLVAQSAKTVTGGQTISLNTARLAAGVYIVHVQYNGQSEEQKFVKE